jgi:hypothetical protein
MRRSRATPLKRGPIGRLKVMSCARTSALLAASLLIAGCFGSPRIHTYSGHYSHGFEVSRFVLCGSHSEWWTTGKVRPLLQELVVNERTRQPSVYCEVRARVSGIGLHGHLGRYSREIEVVEVIAVRPITVADCK